MGEEEKNDLFAQLHLRTFCVGIRQMDSTKQILYINEFRRKTFHAIMAAELLECVSGAMKKFNEIIAPKEELAQKNPHEKKNLFLEAVSEVRREICEKQQNYEKYEQPKKTFFSYITSKLPNFGFF